MVMESRLVLATVSWLLIFGPMAVAEQPFESGKAARAQLQERPMQTMCRLQETPLQIRKELVPELVKLFTDKEEVGLVRERAAHVLKRIAREAPQTVVPPSVKRLKEARRERDTVLQSRLMSVIGEAGKPAEKAMPELVKALKSDNDTINYSALLVLQDIGTASATAAQEITDLSVQGESLIRDTALETLNAVIQGKQLAKAMKPALRSEHQQSRLMAIDIVKGVGPAAKPTVPLLIKLLQKDNLDVSVRERAAEALGAVGSPKAQPALLALLQNKKTAKRVKMAAASALADIGKPAPKALDPLMKLAKKANPQQAKMIDQAIKSIKKTNSPPEVENVKLTCSEGELLEFKLPISDKDDITAGMKLRVLQKPEEGRLTRKTFDRFVYRAQYGHPGTYTIQWKGTDGQDDSPMAKAVIQVKADKQAPELVEARAFEEPTQVEVIFDEPVETTSARHTDNYAISGAKVKKAVMGSRGESVTLHTSELASHKSYKLKASGIADRAKARNVLKRAAAEFEYGKQVFENFERYAHGTTPDKITGWRGGRDCVECYVNAKKFSGKEAGNVFYADAHAGDDWQDVLVRDFNPPLQGRYQFEFRFWEPKSNHDGNLWVRSADGRPLIGVGTENPQWEVTIAGEGEVVGDGEFADYRHWIHVTLQVDTEKDRARAIFEDTRDDEKRTYGWFDIPESEGIGSMGVGPDAEWYVDDIRIMDIKAPEVVRAYAVKGPTKVEVIFDEPVEARSARHTDNYAISGAKVKKAVLGSDGESVTLHTSELASHTSYKLAVNGIADRSKARNVLKKDTVEFEYGKLVQDFENYDHGTKPEEIRGWRAGEDCGECYVNAEKFAEEDAGNVFYADADQAGDDWQDVLVRDFNPPLQGRYQFEFKYWEQRPSNHDGNLWVRSADGRPLIGIGTENPQWEVVIAGKGEVVNDSELANYRHWTHATLQVDTRQDRARAIFVDLQDDEKRSYGWFDIPESEGIGSMGVGPDAEWYVDDIRIQQWPQN